MQLPEAAQRRLPHALAACAAAIAAATGATVICLALSTALPARGWEPFETMLAALPLAAGGVAGYRYRPPAGGTRAPPALDDAQNDPPFSLLSLLVAWGAASIAAALAAPLALGLTSRFGFPFRAAGHDGSALRLWLPVAAAIAAPTTLLLGLPLWLGVLQPLGLERRSHAVALGQAVVTVVALLLLALGDRWVTKIVLAFVLHALVAASAAGAVGWAVLYPHGPPPPAPRSVSRARRTAAAVASAAAAVAVCRLLIGLATAAVPFTLGSLPSEAALAGAVAAAMTVAVGLPLGWLTRRILAWDRAWQAAFAGAALWAAVPVFYALADRTVSAGQPLGALVEGAAAGTAAFAALTWRRGH